VTIVTLCGVKKRGWMSENIFGIRPSFGISDPTPIVIVCAVAFTPEGYLSLPTNGISLRWFRAIADYPEFVRAFRDSLWLAALPLGLIVASWLRLMAQKNAFPII